MACRRIVANLPYNIATSLLIQWLEHASAFDSLTLMFQREVAERVTMPAGDSNFGRLSILTGWIADSAMLFDIPRAFVPAQGHFVRCARPPVAKPRFPCDRKALETVTRLAFGQRRRCFAHLWKPIGGEALLTTMGMNPVSRPQELDIEAFCRLARAVEEQGSPLLLTATPLRRTSGRSADRGATVRRPE